MADVSDVYAAIGAVLLGVFYPSGPPSPGQLSPVTNSVVRIYPGWPSADQLNKDLAAGIVTVSIFAPPGPYRNTTRYPLEWQLVTPPETTLTLTVDSTGTQITVGGSVSTPQNLAVVFDGHAITYAVQAGDTLASIATSLADLINVIEPASAAGPVVSIPGAKQLSPRVGGFGTSLMEVGRQCRNFRVTYWCPTPALRDSASSPCFAAFMNTPRLTLADATSARLITAGDAFVDDLQKPLIYRRDTVYSVEYATTITEQEAQIVLAQANSLPGSSLGINANF